MHCFYEPDLSHDIISLSEEESKHAVRVLRLSSGDQVIITDGKGTRALAEVCNDHPKRCELKITERKTESTGRSFRLHIAVAPTKNNERIEWFVEKATEIGIDEITFLDCEHSERDVIKTERIEKVAVAAMKQSQQSHMPLINEMTSIQDFIGSSKGDIKLIAHCEESDKKSLHDFEIKNKTVVVLIGPEGDFSAAEINACIANGYQPVALGNTRLRTETAALYAVCGIHFQS
jgi:16S rRNA (uracil1498-N3)-methyltransferase